MSVTELAIAKIKELIVSGQLRPGDRIPREVDLAGQLGLSRSSLREAVRALSMVRVLEVRQGDGTYVTTLEPKLLLESVSFVADLVQDQHLLELVEVRRVLESVATGMAAVRIREDDLGRLAELMSAMRAASNPEELVAADARFHDTIVRAGGNSTLADLLQSFEGHTQRSRIWHVISREGAVEATHRGHDAIYQALACRDHNLAQAAAALHVAESELWMRRALDDGGRRVPGAG